MDYTCYRLRNGKVYLADVSCEEDLSSCCYYNRIFTYTDDESKASGLSCNYSWDNCLNNPAAVSSGGLSELEKIWLIIICCLIFIAILIIIYFIYRLFRLKHEKDRKKSIATGPSEAGLTVEAEEEHSPKLMAAAQILVSNAALRPTTREKSPLDLTEKIAELIKARDEDKLAAFLETISTYYPDQVDHETLSHASGILNAWQNEAELQRYCNKLDFSEEELSNFQRTVEDVEDSPFKSRVHPLIFKHAKQRLEQELEKQLEVREIRTRINTAMVANHLEELENLVDIIRAKQLDKEFEKELWQAQERFEESSKSAVVLVKRDLTSAIGRRDAEVLRRAIQRAEQSQFVSELSAQLDSAKRAIVELEEIEKLKNLHRLKLKNAVLSSDIDRMELALKNVKMDGFGEDLKIEISNLEITLKRRYLQKRLRGNLNVAVKNLDLVRLRRAINEVSAAGFLSELGIELEQAQGILSKLERMELIKKAVLELTNSHIAEIKSYTAPPVQVHKVLMSLLIVLGEDPEVVRDWFEIQVILVKTGKLSLKRRVQDYDPTRLSTGNAKRAANIISDINSQELHSISRAAKVFYLWTSAVVEDRLSTDVILG